MTSSPLTREQIVAEVCSINPVSAYLHRATGDAITHCASPIYTQYQGAGGVIPLAFVGARYGAGYVRVSTSQQRDDGWSIEDQVDRIVAHFLARGQAFRIFSDAGLSGKLPTDDEVLIQKMQDASARRYEEAYQKVLLGPDQSYPPDEREAMEAWLVAALRSIRGGGKAHEVGIDAGRGGIDVPGVEATTDLRLKRSYGNLKTLHDYRPALTELMRQVKSGLVHTLAITDISRLARSHSLSVQITEELQFHRVAVIGLIEGLEWISGVGGGGQLGDQITATILTIIAEYRLREVCTAVIRGLVRMLSSGSPHGGLPYWLERDEGGVAVLVPERADGVRRLVDFALEHDLGWKALTVKLRDRPDIPPPFHAARNNQARWHETTLQRVLSSPALAGYQEAFGRRWRVLPPVVDEESWRRLMRRNEGRSRQKHYPVRDGVHLLTYLLRCQCGATMRHSLVRPGATKTFSYYVCDALLRPTGEKTVDHCRIVQEDAEAFFSHLVVHKADLLLRGSGSSATPERVALANEMARLRSERDTAEVELEKVTAEAQARARADIASLGRTPSAAMVAVLADGDAEVVAAHHALEAISANIDAIRGVLATVLPSEQRAGIAEKIAHWARISRTERNEVLRHTIGEVRCRRSTDGSLSLDVYPRLESQPLLPVILKSEKVGRGWRRTWPTVGEWIDSWGFAPPS